MGQFSKEILANQVGNNARWVNFEKQDGSTSAVALFMQTGSARSFLPGNCRARKVQVSHFKMPPIVNNILMWTFGRGREGREENLFTAGNCQARKVSHFKGRLLWVSFQSIAGSKLVSKPFLVAPKCTMNALNAGADVALFTELTFSAVHLYNLAQVLT